MVQSLSPAAHSQQSVHSSLSTAACPQLSVQQPVHSSLSTAACPAACPLQSVHSSLSTAVCPQSTTDSLFTTTTAHRNMTQQSTTVNPPTSIRGGEYQLTVVLQIGHPCHVYDFNISDTMFGLPNMVS